MGSPYDKKTILQMYQREYDNLNPINDEQEKHKNKMKNLIDFPDKYFKEVKIESGEKTILKITESDDIELDNSSFNLITFNVFGNVCDKNKISNSKSDEFSSLELTSSTQLINFLYA